MKGINHPEMKHYRSQRYDMNCFPIALKNCAIYIDKKLDLKRFIRLAGRAKVGEGLAKTLIQISKLLLEETNDLNDIYEHGGIISIMHPIFNLHTTFCFPTEHNKIMLVNSWIGCNELPLDKPTLKEYLPKPPNNKMYYLLNN